MVIMSYLRWWYGAGWRDAARRIPARIHSIYLSFSVPILLGTMFAPWRRIITPGGGSLGQRGRALVDNLVSRVVGFIVRLLALISAGLLIALIGIGGVLLVVLWPLLPIFGVVMIVWGLL